MFEAAYRRPWGPDYTRLTGYANCPSSAAPSSYFYPTLAKLDNLPVVIRDTIDVTRRLGLPFLWIDALCIAQDSAKSWKPNAYSIDTIHGNAKLIIYAADGADASTCLVAMRPSATASSDDHSPARNVHQNIKAEHMCWTFQERISSRVCLIFIDGRVYYQCRATGMSEDIYADREGAGWSWDLVKTPLQVS